MERSDFIDDRCTERLFHADYQPDLLVRYDLRRRLFETLPPEKAVGFYFATPFQFCLAPWRYAVGQFDARWYCFSVGLGTHVTLLFYPCDFEAQKETTLKTGINYLLQMHLSFALIMLGFLIAANQNGDLSFAGVGKFFSQNNNAPLFLVFFAGFGIKAGFIPFHSWLPRAHPAAPSHVSGVMSGIMIKMGIYGILRITSMLQNDLMAVGTIVLAVGIVSGLLGVIMAIMQHDLKKLLAYHSIENIGIIGIGMGMGILGKASGDNYLMIFGFAGALLHILNHALFKSLLFFTVGNIYYANHAVNMDKLGAGEKDAVYFLRIFDWRNRH